MTLKKFCEQNNLDESRVIDPVIGQGGSILPTAAGLTGYFAEITDTSLIFTNDKLKVRKEVPFTCFRRAEFGIGNGLLWLQCVVDDSPFVFCLTRKKWKSAQGKEILEKIGAQTEIADMKLYNGYTGKKFILYMWK